MTLATAALIFNELMAANVGEVMSPAINFDSWVEIYNPSDGAVSLGGMYLSNDAENLKMWKIPSSIGTIPAKGFKVIWLGSDEIRTDQAPFKLDCDGDTIFLSNSFGQLIASEVYPEAKSRTAWARMEDGTGEWGWTANPTPGATNATAVFASKRLDAPVVSQGSCLFKNTVTVNVNIPEGATLMYTTDGSVPTAPKPDADPENPWTEYIINGNCEGDDATCLVSRDAGGNGDAQRIVDGVGLDGSRGIRIHASASAAEDWDAQFFVYTPDHIWRSGEKYRFHMWVRADKAARIAAQTHTTPHNYIYSSILDGNYNVTTEWQEITYEGTITDQHVGKQGGGWWGGQETVQDMQTIAFNLNIDRQDNEFYFDDVSWELFTGDGQAVEASQQSKDGKFTFSKTTNLCVRLYQDGFLPSVPVTRSYIKTSNTYTLPVISIVGDKKHFTDPKIGFDCDGDGTNGKTGNGQDMPRNYNQPWDRPVNFSYLTPEGEMLFNQDVNIAVSGGWTRSQRFRSFKLKSNKVFDGTNHLDYPFFPQKPYIRSKTLLVRNGGNDIWSHNARFLDPALETIIQRSGIDVDVQSYVPVIEYVNGELRGVLNLREPNNDKFAYANWGYDDEELDAFENEEMKNGTADALNRIIELSETVSNGTEESEEAYKELKTLLDIDEFTNYMAVTMFLDNDDWPNNNIKAYRSQHDGRYRFVSFDLDYAFALRGFNKENDDPFAYFLQFKDAATVDGEANRNRDIVRLLLNLLGHDEFRRKFIDTFCIIGGTVFEPTRAGKIVDELLNNVKPMCQLMKQQGINDGHDPDRAASTIKNKLQGRSQKMAGHLKGFSYAKLRESAQAVKLNTDVEGAKLFINGVAVPTGNVSKTNGQWSMFNGHLFAPVELEAKAPYGYTFAGWKKGTEIISTDPVVSLPEGSSVTLVATFKEMDEEEWSMLYAQPTPVRINEVSASNDIFVNEYFKRSDWVELYNTTDKPVNVEGMYLSDNPDKPKKYEIEAPLFTPEEYWDVAPLLPEAPGTIIPPHGYLIVWCDQREPLTQLHASFKLAAEGDELLLTAADESWTDRLTYGPMKGDETAGRYPDGADEVLTMNIPTIAKTNVSSSYTKPSVIMLKGDVNRDGAVDVADVSAVISFMAGSTDVLFEYADVNEDGAVDVADISAIITIMASK
ncbi:MAG: lamin tail domain-containing protein [Prevotella sp.]|nr:lamin tail domain-containing protein [Prevotella sp.]